MADVHVLEAIERTAAKLDPEDKTARSHLLKSDEDPLSVVFLVIRTMCGLGYRIEASDD